MGSKRRVKIKEKIPIPGPTNTEYLRLKRKHLKIT